MPLLLAPIPGPSGQTCEAAWVLPTPALSHPTLVCVGGTSDSRGCSPEMSLAVPGTPALKAPSFLGSLPFRVSVNPFLYSAWESLPQARSRCLQPPRPSSQSRSQSSLPHQLSETLSTSVPPWGKGPSPSWSNSKTPLFGLETCSFQTKPPLPGGPAPFSCALALCCAF